MKEAESDTSLNFSFEGEVPITTGSFTESVDFGDLDFYSEKNLPKPKSYIFITTVQGVDVHGVYGPEDTKLLKHLNFLPEDNLTMIKKLAWFDNDKKLVFINPNNAKILQCYDLKLGKLKDVGSNNLAFEDFWPSVINYMGKGKSNQNSNTEKVIVISACDKKKMIVFGYNKGEFSKPATSKEFSTGKFVSMVSEGIDYVTGSQDGKIRFYPFIKSNCAFTTKDIKPGFPLTNLIMNNNLGYLVATHGNQIAVCKTKTKKYGDPFSQRLKSKLPDPKVIQVKSKEDKKQPVALSPAKFFEYSSTLNLITSSRNTLYLIKNISGRSKVEEIPVEGVIQAVDKSHTCDGWVNILTKDNLIMKKIDY